eukprot:jgi/Chrpa1/13553/Chrysochromulina_OHIO_Genome00020407-RA
MKELRRCTDFFCFVLFGLTWMVLGAITCEHALVQEPVPMPSERIHDCARSIPIRLTPSDSYRQGPAALLHGKDYLGQRCGEGDFSDRPFVWYPRLAADALEQSELMQTPWEARFYGLCVNECPSPGSGPSTIVDYGHESAEGCALAKGAVWPVTISTFALLHRCVPLEQTSSTTLEFCVEPACTSVGRPCVSVEVASVLGVAPTDAGHVWQLEADDEEPLCLRAHSIHRVSTTTLPNAGATLEWLIDVAPLVQRVYTALCANALRVVAIGVGCASALNVAWLVLLYACSGVLVHAALLAVGFLLLLLTVLLFHRARVGARAGDLDLDLDELVNASAHLWNAALDARNPVSMLLNATAVGAVSGVAELAAEAGELAGDCELAGAHLLMAS